MVQFFADHTGIEGFLSSMRCLSNRQRLFTNALMAFLAVTGIVRPTLAQTDAPIDSSRKSLPISFLPFSDMRSPKLQTADHQGPVMRSYINGRSYWILVDTGASYSIMKQSTIEESKLTVEDAVNAPKNATTEMLGLDNGTLKVVQMPIFSLGPVFLPKIPFIVVSDSLLITLGDDPSFAGILGENFLHIFAVYFDFEHKAFTLFKQGNTTIEERTKLGFDGKTTIVVPLHISPVDERKYLVDVLCNAKPVTLMVDTGSSNTSIYKPLAEFGIPLSATKDTTGQFIAGKDLARSAMATVSLGKSAPVKMSLNFSDGKNGAGETFLEYGDGILGCDYLSQYYVLMDFPAQKMYLRPRTAK